MKSSEEKRTIFVYDTSRGISKLIKDNFSKHYHISFCFQSRQLNEMNFDLFVAVIFIVNDYDEYQQLEIIKLKNKNIIVSTSLKKQYNNLSEIKGIIIFELDLSKKETINFINHFLIQLNFT